MYSNLIGELVKKGLSIKEIETKIKELLGYRSIKTIKLKLSTDGCFTMREMDKIREAFLPEFDITYIFKFINK